MWLFIGIKLYYDFHEGCPPQGQNIKNKYQATFSQNVTVLCTNGVILWGLLWVRHCVYRFLREQRGSGGITVQGLILGQQGGTCGTRGRGSNVSAREYLSMTRELFTVRTHDGFHPTMKSKVSVLAGRFSFFLSFFVFDKIHPNLFIWNLWIMKILLHTSTFFFTLNYVAIPWK